MTSTETRCSGCASLFASLALACAPALAGNWDVQGVIDAESRLFFAGPAHAGQDNERVQVTVTAMPEFHFTSDDGNDRLSVVPMLRADSFAGERTFADMKEFYWLHIGDGWDLRAGIDRVFWGVTESRHLVDIVNQKDFSGELTEEDQLGQAMINLGIQSAAGDFNLFVMPGSRPRRFPGEEDRLRPGIVIDNDNEIYLAGADADHVDTALRYFNILGDYDVGLAWFRGISREPSFLPRPNARGRLRLVPVYEEIDQVSADIQLTRGAFLWKLEAIKRWTLDEDFIAAVAGVEYTLFNVRKGADLGLLFEYLHDERGPFTMPTPFDDDVFFGARYTLNDINDTSLLAGAVVDTGSRASLFSLEFETRLANGLTLDVELRTADDDIGDRFDFGIGDDDYLSVTLGYAF